MILKQLGGIVSHDADKMATTYTWQCLNKNKHKHTTAKYAITCLLYKSVATCSQRGPPPLALV